MDRMSVLLLLSVSCASVVRAQPAIVNAASLIPPGLPNYGVAQGSIFVVVGQGVIANFPNTVAEAPPTTTLAGLSMQIAVAGSTIDVPLVYVALAQDQVAGIVPSDTPTGNGTVTVTAAGRAGKPIPITIVPSAFGIFTLNHVGVGPGVFTGPDLTFNSLADAARLIGPFFRRHELRRKYAGERRASR
jgi:uncharacterized protein (TIGR03437 family)